MEMLPPAGKKILHTILSVLYLGIIAIIAFQFYRYTATTFNNKTATWIVRLPYYPVVFLTAVGMTLYFLTALVNCLSFFEASEKEEVI
jgi:TRAP-type C4-dicarboxylate transport system permease small subunit